MGRETLLLEARNVNKSFGGIKANIDVSMSMKGGEKLGLIGANGSGKTTFLNTVAGFYRADGGQINFDGTPITRMRPNGICKLGIARTFQNFRLFLGMTVRENVIVGAMLRRSSLHAATEAADQVLEQVSLDHKSDALAETLSTGQRKRLEFARALATQPRLLLLDEPLAGVDPGNRKPLIDLLGRLMDEVEGIVIVEHDPKVIRGFCTKVIAMDRGSTIAEGTAEEVFNDPEVRRAYLEGLRA